MNYELRIMGEKDNIVLSGIIIAKDSEKIIGRCIKSLNFCDEVIVVDTGSTDKTKEVAKKLGCKVFKYINNSQDARVPLMSLRESTERKPKYDEAISNTKRLPRSSTIVESLAMTNNTKDNVSNCGSYNDWRNFGKEKTKGGFIFYLDTDEEVSEELKKDVLKLVKDWHDGVGCYAIPRKNIVFGKWLKHGGWYPDYVIRLFKKDNLIKWESELHEQPVYRGKLCYLKEAIVHYKENYLQDMLVKTNNRSGVEGRLMYEAGHPPMTVLRFASAMFREFWFRFIKKLAFLDGGEGIIMGLYQVYSRFISYAKLWELQVKAQSIKLKTKS